jgi:hypothetical protein
MNISTIALLLDDPSMWERALPIDWTRHTMERALLPYLALKVHDLIQSQEWSRIFIAGDYDRTSQISSLEKNDKLFNWQRPTAEAVGSDLVLKCYPGCDYVLHYALIVATYLDMKGRFRNNVLFRLPDERDCEEEIRKVNVDPSADDVVIVGYGIEHFTGSEDWQYEQGYAWKRDRNHEWSILYLGFFHSIWGDVAGRVTTRLARLGARRLIYIGKVGCLDSSVEPNMLLATGNQSIIDSRLVKWTNFFDEQARHNAVVTSGLHITSPSTLLETKDWLDKNKMCSFVDPEIGHMGKAARCTGLPFGYLHIISNNLSRFREENLSNERLSTVLTKREHLLNVAQIIITERLRSIVARGLEAPR